MVNRIFISYRREDSRGWAGRLYDRLASHFGPDRIFMDVDAIEPGLDFVDAINVALGASDALLVVIGPDWLGAADSAGNRRLDNPDDFVRLEIAAALERNVRVIPVLVKSATVPLSTELPGDLKPLARRHAVEISHTRFSSDIQRLVSTLELVLEQAEAERLASEKAAGGQTGPVKAELTATAVSQAPTPQWAFLRQLPVWSWAIMLVLPIAFLGLWIIIGRDNGTPSDAALLPAVLQTQTVEAALARQATIEGDATSTQEAVEVTNDALAREAITESDATLTQEAVEVTEDALTREAITERDAALTQEAVEVTEDALTREAIMERDAALTQEAVEVLEDALTQEAIMERDATLTQEAVEATEDALTQEAVQATLTAAALPIADWIVGLWRSNQSTSFLIEIERNQVGDGYIGIHAGGNSCMAEGKIEMEFSYDSGNGNYVGRHLWCGSESNTYYWSDDGEVELVLIDRDSLHYRYLDHVYEDGWYYSRAE